MKSKPDSKWFQILTLSNWLAIMAGIILFASWVVEKNWNQNGWKKKNT